MSFLALTGTHQRNRSAGQFEPREDDIPKLVVRRETAEQRIILHVVGSLSIEHVEVLHQGLRQAWRAGFSRIVIDLSYCTYVDSAGVAVLVLALTQSQRAGVSLVVGGVGPQVRRILALLRLDTVFASRSTTESEEA